MLLPTEAEFHLVRRALALYVAQGMEAREIPADLFLAEELLAEFDMAAETLPAEDSSYG